MSAEEMNAEHLMLHLADEHKVTKSELQKIAFGENPLTDLRDLHEYKHKWDES